MRHAFSSDWYNALLACVLARRAVVARRRLRSNRIAESGTGSANGSAWRRPGARPDPRRRPRALSDLRADLPGKSKRQGWKGARPLCACPRSCCRCPASPSAGVEAASPVSAATAGPKKIPHPCVADQEEGNRRDSTRPGPDRCNRCTFTGDNCDRWCAVAARRLLLDRRGGWASAVRTAPAPHQPAPVPGLVPRALRSPVQARKGAGRSRPVAHNDPPARHLARPAAHVLAPDGQHSRPGRQAESQPGTPAASGAGRVVREHLGRYVRRRPGGCRHRGDPGCPPCHDRAGAEALEGGPLQGQLARKATGRVCAWLGTACRPDPGGHRRAAVGALAERRT